MIKDLKSSNTGETINPNIVSENIPSGAVTTGKLADASVTTSKLNNGAVTTDKLNDGSVTTGKLADTSVTTSKLKDSAVTSGKINDGAVNYDKLATALKNLINGKASASDLTEVQNALTSHTGNTSNPHNVTKSQVGLGNVDNTSDANKPISTATQTALDGKASLSSNNTFTGDNNFTGETTLDYLYIDFDRIEDTNTETLKTKLDDKQDKLVSGTNLKTINNQSLLGSGNIDIQDGSSLYKHTIKLKYDDNKSFVIVEIFKTNSTPITSRSELCNYFNINNEILANGYIDYSEGASIISVTILGKNPTETDPLNPFLFLDTHFVYNDVHPYTYESDSLDIYTFDTLSIIQII